MSIREITQFAKKEHRKLLLAGLVACLGVGLTATQTTTANDDEFMGATFHSPSTKLADKTDLGEDLVGHKFKSNQFTNLLVHQFKEQYDSDISNTKSGSDLKINENHPYELKLGYVSAKANRYPCYSDVSDANNSSVNNGSAEDGSDSESNSPQTMTYFVTKHNLILREMFMTGRPHDTLRLVKYHLHTVAKGTDDAKKFTFYPTEFQYKNGHTITIPSSKQSDYPMQLVVGESSSVDSSSNNDFPAD